MGLAMATTLYEPAFAVVVSWFADTSTRVERTSTRAERLNWPDEIWPLV
jgi:hypothetical protein